MNINSLPQASFIARIQLKQIQLQRTQMQKNRDKRRKRKSLLFFKEVEGGPRSKSNGGERELVLKDPTSSSKSVGSCPFAAQAFSKKEWDTARTRGE